MGVDVSGANHSASTGTRPNRLKFAVTFFGVSSSILTLRSTELENTLVVGSMHSRGNSVRGKQALGTNHDLYRRTIVDNILLHFSTLNG